MHNKETYFSIPKQAEFLSFLQCADWLWSLPSPYPIGSGGSFSSIKQLGGKSMLTDLHALPRLL